MATVWPQIGCFLGALAVGSAQLFQKARSLFEKRVLDELRTEIARAELLTQQEIKKAATQAADEVRTDLSKLLREERTKSARLPSDLIAMNTREDERIDNMALVRGLLALPQARPLQKLGQ